MLLVRKNFILHRQKDTGAIHQINDGNDLYSIVPIDSTKPYDMMEVIERLVDNSEFDQFKQDYGKTIICGYGRIDGWAVGIVANQRKIVKNRKKRNANGWRNL